MRIGDDTTRKIIVTLAVILVTGVYVRTYHFHDWLRFNADQSRDATVVGNYLDGKTVLPLLGPKAGGTDFRVGPAFYYFQIASAKIFGNFPDRMAYPDLFFSILAIPLLFLFLRKYFDARTALMLTAIFSLSAFSVKYSRFAWNPNSLPFWSLLLLNGLHEIMTAKEKALLWWPLFTGVALGIGFQLHTLSMLLFPIMTFGTLAYLLYLRKKNIWKSILTICFIALLLNVPQIASEIKTGGDNAGAFFRSIGTKEKKGSGIAMNFVKDTVCFSQANVYLLTSYDSSDTCALKSLSKGLNMAALALGLFIFAGGLVLAIWYFKKEKEIGRRYFLGICISYLALSFLLFLPLANEISMRFFLIIAFMPFVLLGVWFKYLRECVPKLWTSVLWSIGIILLAANFVSVEKSFAAYASYLGNSDAGMDNALLKEVELSSSFVVPHSGGAKTVVVGGDGLYLFKALKSMQYFTEKSGVKLIQKSKKTDPSLPVFLIDNTKNTNNILQKNNPVVSDHESFGRFSIFSLQRQ